MNFSSPVHEVDMNNKRYLKSVVISVILFSFLLIIDPVGKLSINGNETSGLLLVEAGTPGQFGCGLITISFDNQKPGTYQSLTISGVTFKARVGKGFQIASLTRTNTSPPYALVVPESEIVDLTFDKDFGTVTGLGVTQGLVASSPSSGDTSIFGFTTKFPKRWASLPIPNYATLVEYQPSPPSTELSIEIRLTKSISDWYNGVKQTLHFGRYLGVVDDGTFHGEPGLGYSGSSTPSPSGAFFDDLTIESAMGKAMPYRLNGSCAKKVDVIFMPDKTYGTSSTSFDTFYGHLSSLMESGWAKNTIFQANKEKFNLYYITDQAKVNFVLGGFCSSMADPPSAYGTWGSTDSVYGKGFSSDFPFADGVVILQTQVSRYGGYCPELANSKPLFHMYKSDASIFFHEAGHGFFDLADEYAFNGYGTYWEASPYPNIWDSKQECVQDASKEGWDPTKCNEFYSGWWKIDPEDAMSNTGRTEYGPACSRNAKYFFSKLP
jgi:hypothetical protein